MILFKCYDIVLILIFANKVQNVISVFTAKDQNEIANEIKEFLSITEQTQESTFQMRDEKWISTALKDIAHYLRNHKYNEWDRRYYNEKPEEGLIGYFRSFPVPPLRALHWNVDENCNNNFYKCIIYLHSVINTAPFYRNDELFMNHKISLAIKYNTSEKNLECKKKSINAEKSGLPFDAPVEKFQWRTSASYYICWYTMLGTPALSMLGESCDNFANCLDQNFGYHNNDVRSDDRLSFACAMYSFCPDPCCPMKHARSRDQCIINKNNPCFAMTGGLCRMDRKENQNLKDIIANKWNVTCDCNERGYVWKSQYGMCVDINECVTGEHNCNHESEDCLNLPGTHKCICKWGYVFDLETTKCVQLYKQSYSELRSHELL